MANETWGELKARCIRMLQDTNRDVPLWTDDDMLDYVNVALQDITPHHARKITWETSLIEASTALDMPEGFYAMGPVAIQVQGLYWQMLVPYSWQPDETLPTPYTFSLSSNSYYEWPKGHVNFLFLIPANVKLRFNYYSYWDAIRNDSDTFSYRHKWFQEALFYNIMSQALMKGAVQSANLRQWNINVDSGQPEHNPMWRMSEAYRLKYERVLGDHPPQDRSVWDNGD